MTHSEIKLAALVRSVVEPMGYELVGVEQCQRGGSHGGSILRIYIDAEEGINLDDCAAVSHQLSGVLDVEDPIQSHYDLEVSSPGMDRPLFGAEHYNRFRGQRAKVRLGVKLKGRRNFEGLLAGVEGDCLRLEVEGIVHELPLAMIESARLVPEF